MQQVIESFGVILGVLILIVIVYVVLVFVSWLIEAIGNVAVFRKAGVDGWKAFVPVYSRFQLYKICWETKWFFVELGLICFVFLGSYVLDGSLLSIFTENLAISGSKLLSYIVFPFEAALIVMHALLSYHESRKFGHELGYAAGLFFLRPIFSLVIGYGKSEILQEDEI